MPERYYEDLLLREQRESRPLLVGREQMLDFAQRYDPHCVLATPSAPGQSAAASGRRHPTQTAASLKRLTSGATGASKPCSRPYA
jgi:hypothetical protein